MTAPKPSRGDLWMVDLDPTRGHEQAGRCPALVVSDDGLNHGPAGLVVILPVTSRARGLASHISIAPPEGGLVLPSFIKSEDIRSVAKERLSRRLGSVTPRTLAAVDYRLRLLQNL